MFSSGMISMETEQIVIYGPVVLRDNFNLISGATYFDSDECKTNLMSSKNLKSNCS